MLLPSSSAAWLLSSDVMFKHASVCKLAPLCCVTLHPGIEDPPTPSTSVLVQWQVACRNGDACRSLGQAEVGEHGEEEARRCVRSSACVPNVPPIRNVLRLVAVMGPSVSRSSAGWFWGHKKPCRVKRMECVCSPQERAAPFELSSLRAVAIALVSEGECGSEAVCGRGAHLSACLSSPRGASQRQQLSLMAF